MSFPRYPRYKDSGVPWLGEVPEHWDIKQLKYLCDIIASNVDKKSYDGETSVCLCNYTDVYYNRTISAGMAFLSATATSDQIAKFTLRAGDVIITKDSETADDIAIPSFVPDDLPGVLCGYHLSIIRSAGPMHGLFVRYLFESIYVKSNCANLASGLTRVGLSYSDISGIMMPVPPVPEQRLIIKFLECETGKIDSLIGEQERLIELLKEKRQAVISQSVTKGLDPTVPMKPSGIEWLGDIPAHWDIVEMRRIARIVRGASPRPAGDPLYFNGDAAPWVTVGEITKDDFVYLTETETRLTAEGAKLSNLFVSGTVVYSNSGATLGVPKILKIDACANDGVVAFLELNQRVEPRFLYFYLFSITDCMRDLLRQGSGQPNLNTDLVKEIRMPMPPTSEQLAIAGAVEGLREEFGVLISEAERAIGLLRERRTALISAAVTGQIDVRGFAKEQPA